MGVEKIDVDRLWMDLGRYGRYQMWHYVLFSLSWIYTTWHMMIISFQTATPDHHCVFDSNSTKIWPYASEKCQITVNTTDYQKEISCGENNTHIAFDQNFGTTIVSEWNLACDPSLSILADTAGAMYMIGCFIGGFIVSIFSDRFGRKWPMMVCMLISIPITIGTAFVHNYSVYAILRLIAGLVFSGISSITFTFSAEVFTADRRSYVGLLLSLVWVASYVILGIIADFERDWRKLQLIISVPTVLMAIYPFVTRESVAWLSTTGRLKEAKREIELAGRINRVPVNPDDYVVEEEKEEETPTFVQSLRELLSSRILCIYTAALFYIWFVDSFVYYGLSLFSTNLTSNRFLSFCLMGAVEAPAYFTIPVCFSKLGRSRSCVLFHAIAGLCLLIILAIPTDNSAAIITMSLIGKFAISGIFQGMYTYTTELYPTGLRTAGLGFSYCAARAGGIIAPYVGLMGKHNKRIPTSIFGVLAVVACVVAVILPETRGKPLPDYAVDVEESLVLRKLHRRKLTKVADSADYGSMKTRH